MKLKNFFALLVSVGVMTTAQAAQAWETFSVDNGSNPRMALNTNNGFRTIDGNPRMSLWQRNNADPDQQFNRLPGNRGGTLLQHRTTGKCLNAYRVWNGAEINVWNCDPNDPDQNFNIVNIGGGYNLIKRANTNFCVDSPTRDNLGKIHLWDCNSGNPNQRWLSSGYVAPPPPSPSGNVTLPFGVGQTWYVCQGYQNSISHGNTFGLDLTVSNQDFGRTGCWAYDGNWSKSAGRPVLAPASGTIYHVNQDLVCLSIDANRSLLIGHIGNRVAHGTRVSAGQQLGIVSRASSVNGNYSHIHLEGRRSSNCRIGTSVPLTAANGLQLIGIGDLSDLAGTNDHFRRALRRP
jgi:hypothetical protein